MTVYRHILDESCSQIDLLPRIILNIYLWPTSYLQLEAKTAVLLDAIVVQELADGENASVLMEKFADPAARRALMLRIEREETAAAKEGGRGAASKEDTDSESAYMWQFEASPGVWQPFEAMTVTTIESAFDAGKKTCEYTREGGGASYTVTNLQRVRRKDGTARQKRTDTSVFRSVRRLAGQEALREQAREGAGDSDGSSGGGAAGETDAQRRRRVTGLKAAAATDTTIDITAAYGALHEARTKRLAAGSRRAKGWFGRISRGDGRAATKEGDAVVDAFSLGQNADLDAAQRILAKTPGKGAHVERAAFLNELRSAWRRERSLQTKAYERSKIAPFLLRYGSRGGGASGAASKEGAAPPDLRTQRQGSSGRAGARPGGAGSSASSSMARIARTKRIQNRLQGEFKSLSLLLFQWYR